MLAFQRILALILAVLMNLGIWTPSSYEIKNVPEKNEGAVRIISFNVRCKDDLYGSVENRSKLIVSAIRQYAPDSFGVQEATEEWIDIFNENLGDEYGCISQMRNSASNSEASAVFYLKSKYELLDSGTIWLSDTPEKFASKFLLSSFPRIATWATLKDKTSGKVYTHINTHFDHVLEFVREKQAKVLCNKIAELAKDGHPVFCTGDFNSNEGAKAYKVMTSVMKDSKYVAITSDSGATFTNYGKTDSGKPPIDFVFVPQGTKVDTYKIIDEKIGGMYLSDHAGLCVDLYI